MISGWQHTHDNNSKRSISNLTHASPSADLPYMCILVDQLVSGDMSKKYMNCLSQPTGCEQVRTSTITSSYPTSSSHTPSRLPTPRAPLTHHHVFLPHEHLSHYIDSMSLLLQDSLDDKNKNASDASDEFSSCWAFQDPWKEILVKN